MPDLRLWDRFVYSRPGRRFREHYHRVRQAGGAGRWRRLGFVTAGIVFCVVGLFFMAVPGPGIPILAVGIALMAQASKPVARLCDRMEIRIRRLVKRFRDRWNRGRSPNSGTEP